jgi:D-3-phosphoglycerate dehydrogenase
MEGRVVTQPGPRDPRPRVGFVGPSFAHAAVVAVLEPDIEPVLIPIDELSLRAALPTLDGLVEATTRLPIDAGALSVARRLQIISVAGTGANHIDRGASAANGIIVRTLVEDPELLAAITPTAEHTWGLVLALVRGTVPAAQHVIDGGWERERFPGLQLKGRRLGIVGLGRLGRWVAGYGDAFGMDVVAYEPVGKPGANWPEHVTRVSLEDLFTTSDVISVHVPLTESTSGLVDRSLLQRMHPGAVLVNTSRGAVVDEDALLDMLRQGKIGGAALDVLVEEPPSAHHPLVAFAREDARLLLTPHLGGFVPEVVTSVCAHAAEKVRAHLATSVEPTEDPCRTDPDRQERS